MNDYMEKILMFIIIVKAMEYIGENVIPRFRKTKNINRPIKNNNPKKARYKRVYRSNKPNAKKERKIPDNYIDACWEEINKH